MTKKTAHFSFKLLALDFNLLNISFFALNYWKRGTFAFSPAYLKLLFGFYIIWLGVSILIKKFRFDPSTSYWDAIILYTKSAILNAYCVSVMVVLWHLTGFSRVHIYGTCALLFLMNTIILLTGHGTIESAVNAIKGGAYDYITKPLKFDEIELIVNRAFEKHTIFRNAHVPQDVFIHTFFHPPMDPTRDLFHFCLE